ncbi:putative phage tail protein [Halorubrum alkaliphilum]|uniref:Putative phage tail protein n=1 Tax=Halorubrum alkaliphilum TaxID=261290 RepID=A0A8T4GEX0_9EURY|nr:hypothetical protein [Halorubrum alkaliphilum]MBP1922277.1 putative phage tail protein [Halorubrum alkaliphilum]
MRKTLGLEGIAGALIVFLAIAVVTLQDPVIGGGMMLFVAGLALIAKGIADSTMRAFGMK